MKQKINTEKINKAKRFSLRNIFVVVVVVVIAKMPSKTDYRRQEGRKENAKCQNRGVRKGHHHCRAYKQKKGNIATTFSSGFST